MSSYDEIVGQLSERMDANLNVAKTRICNKLTSFISRICIGLEMLDNEHMQLENGTEAVNFHGNVNVVSNTMMSFDPITMECDDIIQTFRMRNRCILAGDVQFLCTNNNTKQMTCFYIIPQHVTSNNINLTATSAFGDKGTISINIKLDDKKRIKSIKIDDIDLKLHPNSHKYITNTIIGNMEFDNIWNTQTVCDKIAFEFAKMSIKPP